MLLPLCLLLNSCSSQPSPSPSGQPEAERSTLEEQLAGLRAQNDALQQAQDVLTSQNEALERELNDLTDQLELLRTEMETLQLQQEAAPVIAAIDGIGEVTLDSEALLSSIQARYVALRPAAKEHVTNYQQFTDAQAAFRKLEASVSDEERAQAYKAACLSGYSYTQLERNPDDYIGQHVRFTGKVVQVSERTEETILRVNITQLEDGTWEDTLYVTYHPETGRSRILVDDVVVLYGEMQPLQTYATVVGTSVTIPAMQAEYIDLT